MTDTHDATDQARAGELTEDEARAAWDALYCTAQNNRTVPSAVVLAGIDAMLAMLTKCRTIATENSQAYETALAAARATIAERDAEVAGLRELLNEWSGPVGTYPNWAHFAPRARAALAASPDGTGEGGRG